MENYRKEKDRKVVAAPIFFIEYCIRNAKSTEHKQELERALEKVKSKRRLSHAS